MDTNMRSFETGATRHTSNGKLEYEGFLHPVVLKSYAEYMHSHRIQADGELRDADNWQKGIPTDVYMSSLFRHFMDLWSLHRGLEVKREDGEPLTKEEAINACLFNLMGYSYELQMHGE